MMPDRYMPDVIAPKILYDFIRAIKAPGRAARGEVLDEEEALNTALNMFGGGLATSGSVPIGALGMSARTAPAGTVPLREIPRSPLGFYSKVEEATLPLQNKGSGGQFLAQIQKTPGVKPEEIEVLGLDKFLQSKPTVTKQEVQDYITANKPDVQEVRLDEPQFTTENRLELESLFNIPRRERTAEQSSRVDELLAISDREIDQPVTKFSKYTIPGGENYRELLLTLPSGPRQTKFEVFDPSTQRAVPFQTREEAVAFANQDPTRSSVVAEVDVSKPEYRSSHFDQPNILTHLRANDRVIDGKKALFIEEIQSDWHQAGRKKGYNKLPDDAQVVQSPYSGNFMVQRANGNYLGESATTREEAIQSAIKHFGGVPDAPFKKSWHELALKRAIQEAVDKGYDKLAFTTGKTQAERYDLSKQVNKLVWNEQTGTLAAQRAGGDTGTIKYENVTADKLSDYIGKEAADKLTKAKDLSGWKTIEGDDLRVGGEGMKGFYDEILPKALQNLTKKYGTKVTKTKLDARGEDKLSTKLRENGYDPYNADLQQILTDNGGRQPRWLNDTDITALELGYTSSLKDTGVEVWSMDITPQMREQIKAKGQPLFATAPPLGLASQDPLEQFLQTDEARNDPLMQFLGQK
jgi:hypothetical protein